MNAPFFRPTEIDWQDGLNPLAIPAYREQRNPFNYAALQEPTMVELRNTPGYEPAIYAAPDAAFMSINGSATADTVMTFPPGCWVIGASAYSTQPEGFLVQVTMPAGGTLYHQAINSAHIAGAVPQCLSRPLGVPNGGTVRVRMINLSAVANLSQFALWVIQPK